MNFFNDQVVRLTGIINEENSNKLLEAIGKCYKTNPSSPIVLAISSGGGNAGIGWGLYDLLKSMDLNLTTIAFGHVSSMAIPIFCLGKKRLVTVHTLIYIHETGNTFKEETVRASEMLASANKLSTSTKWQADIVSKVSGGKITRNRWLDMMAKEKCLNAKEMIKFGIAHKILKTTD
jgi:ATP-dependent protease ClpP protease subunit